MVVHCQKQPYDTYIGRAQPGYPRSPWANPFKIGTHGNREQVIEKYRVWVRKQPALMAALGELKGKRLGCWCVSSPVTTIRDHKQCHGEVLIELLQETGL